MKQNFLTFLLFVLALVMGGFLRHNAAFIFGEKFLINLGLLVETHETKALPLKHASVIAIDFDQFKTLRIQCSHGSLYPSLKISGNTLGKDCSIPQIIQENQCQGKEECTLDQTLLDPSCLQGEVKLGPVVGTIRCISNDEPSIVIQLTQSSPSTLSYVSAPISKPILKSEAQNPSLSPQ